MGSGDDTDAPDGALPALVAATLERIDREGAQALEQACQEHPDHAALLRQRVLALREIGLIEAWTAPERAPQRLGDFRLIRRIGAGGMGVVYHAIQESLGREVALKLIRPESLHLPGARERFARETTIIARLQHPGIVPIYSVGGADDLPYYAMERVRGCTLADALEELKAGSFERATGADLARAVRARSDHGDVAMESESALYAGTWEQVSLRILRLVAEALEHAHGRGVLHRDLKPSNIMLTYGGRVMLVDFGLSHSEGSDSVTRSGERAGSLPFMPPELLRDGLRAVDRRSDVYSLGITLYLLLTHRLPFQGRGEVDVYARILEGRPLQPRSIDRRISWEAETVCLAAMERDPARRYASAIDFARDLGHALDRRPIEARRASAWLRTRRWVETRPALAAAIVLALLAPTAIAVAKVIEVRRVTELRQQSDKDRNLAKANFERTLRAVDSMLRRVGSEQLDHVPGVDPLRIELIGEAASLYRELSGERGDDPELAVAAADCELRRADLIARSGDKQAGAAVIDNMLELLQPALLHGDYGLRLIRAHALLSLSRYSSDPGDVAAHQAAALGALNELQHERPADPRVQALMAKAVSEVIIDTRTHGDRQSAAAMLDFSESIARECVASSGSASSRGLLAFVLIARGRELAREGRNEEALAPFHEALALRRAILDAVPDGERERHDVSECASGLGSVLMGLGRNAEALELLQHAASEIECVLSDYPDVPVFQYCAADVLLNLGAAQGRLNREAEARVPLERAAQLLDELLTRTPTDADLHQTLGTTLLNLSDTTLSAGDARAALDTCARGLEHFETAIALKPAHPDYSSWLAPERSTRAKILLALGRTAEAAEALADAPRLAGHRRERAIHAMKRLLDVLDRAEAEADSTTIERCYEAAFRALELARERGDLDSDPSVIKLAERLGA